MNRNDAIHCRGLIKTYGAGDARVQALRGIDLDVCFGELLMIVGPSGRRPGRLRKRPRRAHRGENRFAGTHIGQLQGGYRALVFDQFRRRRRYCVDAHPGHVSGFRRDWRDALMFTTENLQQYAVLSVMGATRKMLLSMIFAQAGLSALAIPDRSMMADCLSVRFFPVREQTPSWRLFGNCSLPP